MEKMEKTIPGFPETVHVLGSVWRIVIRKYDEDPDFGKKHYDGWASFSEREICLLDLRSDPQRADVTEKYIHESMKATLRHELVHAMFDESGLAGSTTFLKMPWAKNEEMVDWIALQGEKLYALWKEAGCLSGRGD